MTKKGNLSHVKLWLQWYTINETIKRGKYPFFHILDHTLRNIFKLIFKSENIKKKLSLLLDWSDRQPPFLRPDWRSLNLMFSVLLHDAFHLSCVCLAPTADYDGLAAKYHVSGWPEMTYQSWPLLGGLERYKYINWRPLQEYITSMAQNLLSLGLFDSEDR